MQKAKLKDSFNAYISVTKEKLMKFLVPPPQLVFWVHMFKH
jgi:hypothetical protein